MRMVPDWRQCWRWYSTHALWIATSAGLAWAQVPGDLRHHVPLYVQCAVAIGIFALGLTGRLLDQTKC